MRWDRLTNDTKQLGAVILGYSQRVREREGGREIQKDALVKC